MEELLFTYFKFTQLPSQQNNVFLKENTSTGTTDQNTGYRIQDTGYRIQDTGYRIQDTGYRI